MSPREALRCLRAAKVQTIALEELETDEAFQPRAERLVPFAERARQEAQSEEHVGVLRLALEGNHRAHLEPLLVARIDGTHYVIDGHHRLEAYRRAGRKTLKARVRQMRRHDAVMASKPVNCNGRALTMHAAQRQNAAFQHLADVTCRGAQELPAGESLRGMAQQYGIGKSTIARMLKAIPEAARQEWPDEAQDPGTGFPCWRYVKTHNHYWQEMKDHMSAEELQRHRAESLAKKLGAVLSKADEGTQRRALQILASEARETRSDPDHADFLSEIADESPDF